MSRGASALRLGSLAALLAIAIAVGVRVGAVGLSFTDLWHALLGTGDATNIAIVRGVRLPRVLMAALVGAALAVSGTTYQALLRNPLADPYILGVSSGAAVGAVLAVVTGVAALTPWALPIAAFAGSVVAMVLVLRIALSADRVLDDRVLLLSGVVVGAFFNAVITLMLTFADAESFRSAVFWMMGSLSGASWTRIGVLLPCVVLGVAVLSALARALDLLSLGELTAAYLGLPVERAKWLAYGVAAMLTAAAVSVSGAIGFVGLVVPHVLRLVWGSGHRLLLPASALLGASAVVVADTVARTIAAPTELPIGVVSAMIGVPFFLWLLRRSGANA